MKLKMLILSFAILLSIFLPVHSNAALINNSDGTITQIRNDGIELMWSQNANYLYSYGFRFNDSG